MTRKRGFPWDVFSSATAEELAELEEAMTDTAGAGMGPVEFAIDNYAAAQFAYLSGRNCTEEQRDETRAQALSAVAAALTAEQARVCALRGVLERLQQWDMNYVGPDGVHTGADTADGPWARGLISAVLTDTPACPHEARAARAEAEARGWQSRAEREELRWRRMSDESDQAITAAEARAQAAEERYQQTLARLVEEVNRAEAAEATIARIKRVVESYSTSCAGCEAIKVNLAQEGTQK